MTDNIATLAGFTREIAAYSDQGHELYLLIKPETDLDSRFKAWDMEEQEFIRVNGWLFIISDCDVR
jgi:hypothetical protein